MRPRQLPLEPLPPITEADVLQEAERVRLSRAYWWRRYRSLDELLADPTRARWFLICARRALLARLAASR
jgi:hypothetical protein